MKLTIDQEKKRIEAVRKARLGIALTNDHKKKISEAHKRSGHIPSQSLESKNKRAEATRKALKGKKRPAEVVEKIRLANTGKKRTVDQRKKMSEAIRGGYAKGKYQAIGKALERKLYNLEKGRGRENRDYKKQGEEHSKRMEGIKRDPEVVAKVAEKMRGREQKAIATKKGPTNVNSLVGALRSPKGVKYNFRNLLYFVREHECLFSDVDSEWRPCKKGSMTMTCRAYKGLNSLFGRGKVVPLSWKGWTMVSDVEEATNHGLDILERE